MDVEQGKKQLENGDITCVGISSVGLSGGLLMCWNETLKVMVKSMNKNAVNAYISDQHSNNFWITCLYGHPELHLRQQVVGSTFRNSTKHK